MICPHFNLLRNIYHMLQSMTRTTVYNLSGPGSGVVGLWFNTCALGIGSGPHHVRTHSRSRARCRERRGVNGENGPVGGPWASPALGLHLPHTGDGEGGSNSGCQLAARPEAAHTAIVLHPSQDFFSWKTDNTTDSPTVLISSNEDKAQHGKTQRCRPIGYIVKQADEF